MQSKMVLADLARISIRDVSQMENKWVVSCLLSFSSINQIFGLNRHVVYASRHMIRLAMLSAMDRKMLSRKDTKAFPVDILPVSSIANR